MRTTTEHEEWPRPQPGAETTAVFSDDPTDHGLSSAELACIEKAYAIRWREVRAALEPSPRREQRSRAFGIPRPTNVRERLLSMLVLPLF